MNFDSFIASAQFLLPSLCKLLYQLCEASGKCELEGIHTESNLRPTATLLGSVLRLLQQVAETDHERFRKVSIYSVTPSIYIYTVQDNVVCSHVYSLTPFTAEHSLILVLPWVFNSLISAFYLKQLQKRHLGWEEP